MQGNTPFYRLNVGGVLHCVSRETLSLGGGFFSKLASFPPADFEIFIDRNGSIFSLVLDFLRSGVLPYDRFTLDCLEREADFYCLESMREAIRCQRREADPMVRIALALEGMQKKMKQG